MDMLFVSLQILAKPEINNCIDLTRRKIVKTRLHFALQLTLINIWSVKIKFNLAKIEIQRNLLIWQEKFTHRKRWCN